MAELRRDAELDSLLCRRWVKLVTSSNSHRRQDALRKFRALPVRQRRLITVLAYRSALEYVGSLIAIGVVIVLAITIIGSIIAPMASAILASIGVLAVFVAITLSLTTSRYYEVVKNLLDQTQDTGIIPFLLMRLNYARDNGRAPRHAFAGRNMRNALVRLLPYAQEADAAEWTSHHWRFLLRPLQKPFEDIELTLAILDVCARLGNAEAMRAVERMVQQIASASTMEGRPASIRLNLIRGNETQKACAANCQLVMEQAQNTLVPLDARILHQRQMNTLLRPSDQGAAVSSDVLLRPSDTNTSATPANELLRPPIGDNESPLDQ